MLKLAIDPEAAARLQPLLEGPEPEVELFNEAVVRLVDRGVRASDIVELLLLALGSYKWMKQTRA